MSMTDPIADLLTRIRNGQKAANEAIAALREGGIEGAAVLLP